jgi:hypothetical protein
MDFAKDRQPPTRCGSIVRSGWCFNLALNFALVPTPRNRGPRAG